MDATTERASTLLCYRRSMKVPQPILFVLLTILLLHCKPHETQQPRPCDDFELDVQKFWNDETRIRLVASLENSWSGQADLQVAKKLSQTVATNLDQITSDWVMLRRSTCLDYTQRRTMDKDTYIHRVQCLDDVLVLQRTLATSLTGNTHDEIKRLLENVWKQLARC